MTEAHRVRKDDQGATLILVLIFTLVTSLTVAGLLTAMRNDLSNSKNFASARSLQYDATTAIDLGIQQIRYAPLISSGQTLNASPPMPCWAAGSGGTYGLAYPSENTTPDGVTMAVWCSTAWFPTSASTRVVTISACQASILNSACVQNPVLQSVVTFDDYPAGGSEPDAGQCVVYCGVGLTINSWLQYPAIPSVSGLSSTSGPSTPASGSTITVTGSGFAEHSTINFVEESGGVPTSNNVVISVADNGPYANNECSSTSCTALVPAVTQAGNYFVTVTTPEGTSADSSGEVYDFQAAAPTITGVTSNPASSPLGGPSTGGTFVTISGSNFIAGDAVNFVQESLGTAVGQPIGANSVTLSRTGADTVVITALAPNISSVSPATYFVEVASPSNGTANDSSIVFTYTAVVPTVNIVTPTSGASGAAITIIGSGFLSGATVSFTPESGGTANGTAVTATNVVVAASGEELTADAPTLQNGTTYFVTVSNSIVSGQSSYFPIFTGT